MDYIYSALLSHSELDIQNPHPLSSHKVAAKYLLLCFTEENESYTFRVAEYSLLGVPSLLNEITQNKNQALKPWHLL